MSCFAVLLDFKSIIMQNATLEFQDIKKTHALHALALYKFQELRGIKRAFTLN